MDNLVLVVNSLFREQNDRSNIDGFIWVTLRSVVLSIFSLVTIAPYVGVGKRQTLTTANKKDSKRNSNINNTNHLKSFHSYTYILCFAFIEDTSDFSVSFSLDGFLKKRSRSVSLILYAKNFFKCTMYKVHKCAICD